MHTCSQLDDLTARAVDVINFDVCVQIISGHNKIPEGLHGYKTLHADMIDIN